jgi:hypothetical protein
MLLSINTWNQHKQQLNNAKLLALHYKRFAQLQAEPETVVAHEELEKEMAQQELAFRRSRAFSFIEKIKFQKTSRFAVCRRLVIARSTG